MVLPLTGAMLLLRGRRQGKTITKCTQGRMHHASLLDAVTLRTPLSNLTATDLP